MNNSITLLPPQFLQSLYTYQWHSKRRVSFRLARTRPNYYNRSNYGEPPRDAWKAESNYWAGFFEHPEIRVYAVYPAQKWVLVSFDLPQHIDHDHYVSKDIIEYRPLESCIPLVYPAKVFQP